MASNAVPSFTGTGWITDIATKCDTLMSYYFETDAFQDSIYKDSLCSIQYDLEQAGNNSINIYNKINASVTRVLSRYFDSVTVSVNVDQSDTGYTIRLGIIVTENGRNYSLGKLIETNGTKVKDIITLNN